MQHRLPHLSPPGGCFFAPRLAVAAVAAVAALAAVASLVAVAALVVVFAMTLAASSQS
jgi:hypothetical protein